MNDKAKPNIAGVLSPKGRNTTGDVVSKASKTVEAAKAKLRQAQITEEVLAQPATKETNAQIAHMAKELDKMFSPTTFRGIVRAPADLMLATSGRKIWDLPKEEVDTLATTGSMAARYFMATDPKWLALTLFAMSALTTYGTRAVLHANEKRAEKEKEKDKK